MVNEGDFEDTKINLRVEATRPALDELSKNNYKNNQEVIIEKLKSELKEFSNKDNYDDDILIVMLKNN